MRSKNLGYNPEFDYRQAFAALLIFFPSCSPSSNALLDLASNYTTTIGLAALSYHLTEKPFLNLRMCYKKDAPTTTET